MSSFAKVEFSPDHIKNITHGRIINKVFELDGIVFGGYVRDKIISNHNTHLFNDIHNNKWDTKKFWNKQYHPETQGRMIVAKDLDICVSDNLSAKTIIDSVKMMIYEDFGDKNIVFSSEYTTNSDNKYFGLSVSSITKLSFDITIGNIPFIHEGVTINISLDIVVRINSYNQPPFGNLDFLCNMFIMTKNGITISRNTGTIIDKMSVLNKKKVELKVMSDIIEYKTDFCLNIKNFDNTIKYNCSVCDRLEKMSLKVPSWTIENMPINMCGNMTTQCNKKEACCICMSGFKKMNGTISLSIQASDKKSVINGAKMHDSCIFKYMRNQLNEEYIDATDRYNNDYNINNFDKEFYFKCPLRNLFNFTNCSKEINTLLKKIIV
jgi:hypothetical protein